jgi:hypothetical protein
MKGRHGVRRFGWDTHGLPIEHEIDKKLGISGRDAVMEMGIAKYNTECRAIVMKYAAEWRETINRLGRWVDFDNDYKVISYLNRAFAKVLTYWRQWTPPSWNPFGGCSSSYLRKARSIDRIKSCLIRQRYARL